MELPAYLENDPLTATAFGIYASAWESHLKNPQNDAIISTAANSLHQCIVSAKDSEEAIYCAISGLRLLFTLVPTSIDFGLSIFAQGADLLPDNVTHTYGKGPTGAKNILKWFLVDHSTFFQGAYGPIGHEKIGQQTNDDPSSLDSSNIIFRSSEVARSETAVRAQLEVFQKARTEIIVMMTMMGRCHVMDLARICRETNKGDQISGFVDLTLKRQYEGTPRWGKVDFVANCVMLRSCAKSLIESLPEDIRDSTVTRWKKGFASFLSQAEGGKNFDEDFAVKVHAARVLENLEHGPVDEESRKLFDPAAWVF